MPPFESNPLIADLIAGKESAFELLYDRLGARLLRVAKSICGSHAEAEDVVQDALINLIKLGARLADVQNLEGYLFTSVQRGAVARASRRRKERDIAEKIDVQSSTEESGDGESLERMLSKLPEDQRMVVALKIDGELTFEEIGAVLQISANTAASRYRYALEKLRHSLAAHVPREMKEA